jgi:Mg2+/Co2+ transporter CorB
MTHRKSVVFLEVANANKEVKEFMLRASFHLSSLQQKNYDDIVGVANLKSIFATIVIILILVYKV